MEVLLGKVTQQAMNYAIRSGITITAGYAIKQSTRLLKAVEDTVERDELQDLQERLDGKIRIISPAIDMIELISARGNTSLESAVTLCKQLRWDIQQLGQRISTAANAEERFRRKDAKVQDSTQHASELRQISQAIRKLLSKIEDSVPLISLAITASGASLSSALPTTVSPSRLLQASTFVTAGDSQYVASSTGFVQIGPTFTLSLYMLFQGHIRPQSEEDIQESTWKEVIHKAVVRLLRVPMDTIYSIPGTQRPLAKQDNAGSPIPATENLSTDEEHSLDQIMAESKIDEYAYQLVIVEDLNDDRVHTVEDDGPQPGPCGDVDLAGIREALPVHELSKIFYADTGKILNIGSEADGNRPVLLLKRDPNAVPPRRMMNRYGDIGDLDCALNGRSSISHSPSVHRRRDQTSANTKQEQRISNGVSSSSQEISPPDPDLWRFPPGLDPEWMAFEVYAESEDSDTEEEDGQSCVTNGSRPSRSLSVGPAATSALSHLSLDVPKSASPFSRLPTPDQPQNQTSALPPIRTSLSLLETLLRLLALQQFQQTPHLSIPDELLTFFISESASTGAASNDIQERKRLREEARRRVGFDPYDESPIKRRGEDYQYRDNGPGNWDARSRSFPYERYGNPVQGEHSESRYDDEVYDGYDTRNTTVRQESNPSTPRRATSEAAEQWFRNEQGSIMSISTGPSPSPIGRPAPLTRRSDGGRYGLRNVASAAGRGGSPLARSASDFTDEGIGTSPTAPTKQ